MVQWQKLSLTHPESLVQTSPSSHMPPEGGEEDRGKFHYFGKVANDPEGKVALDKWLDQKDALLAGRVPRTKVEEVTIRDLCNRFLSAKKTLLDNGELNPHTFKDAYSTCQRVGACLGWDRPW